MRLRSGRDINAGNDQDTVAQDAAAPAEGLVQRGRGGGDKCWKRGGWYRQPGAVRLERVERLNKYKK